MSRSAPRSIDEYLRQLKAALAGEDTALIQDALYDAEEYLRSELAAHPGRSEADMLELIASTYGDPEEVAAAYRDTEVKVKAALATPMPAKGERGAFARFFLIFRDPRAYTSLFFMFLSLATGIIYFTLTVTGLSLSAGLAVLIVGVPFFLTFIGLTRVISLAEGRLIEAMTGERMPRRPVHPGPALGFGARIVQMLKDWRTWTTLAYLLLMLPLGIAYFAVASAGLTMSLTLIAAPLAMLAHHLHWFGAEYWGNGDFVIMDAGDWQWTHSIWMWPLSFFAGILLLTILMHAARGIGKLHATFAKYLLVAGNASIVESAHVNGSKQ